MEAFDVCTGCRCHIKRYERICPFCAAPHVAAPALPRQIDRMSRARWLAIGSTLTLMSCTDSTPKPAPQEDAAGVDTAPSDSSADANDVTGSADVTDSDDAVDENVMADARDDLIAIPDAPRDMLADLVPEDVEMADVAPRDQTFEDVAIEDVSSDADASADRDATADARDAAKDGDDGTFPCCPFGSPCLTRCNRKTEICDLTTIPGPRNQPCFTIQTDGGNYPEQCQPAPSCWCIDPFFASCAVSSSSTYGCSEYPGGGVSISCNGCYGSPPVRWERWIERESAARA